MKTDQNPKMNQDLKKLIIHMNINISAYTKKFI